ncbi:CsbD family protein [Sandaracinus amylolyticus]|uniref:CsbD-like domain-containing protein n=1 Tax=Sandaracinus amylolyticus TaxID=927083 RepID=A0A0F6W5V0_9BACT|nr:CsbD family protein [Sandaracinus amylolyticus]AKF08198.1 Hypothetical protein DB32_005347 [Sandaracinus amylolyticus]
MTWDDIAARWRQLKGQVKTEFGKLDDDTFDAIGGDRERLVAALEEKYGYPKEHAVQRVDSWVSRLDLRSRPASATATT